MVGTLEGNVVATVKILSCCLASNKYWLLEVAAASSEVDQYYAHNSSRMPLPVDEKRLKHLFK